MQVDGTMVAQELRRRRVGRRVLAESIDSVTRSTWLPGELRKVPTSLLVLAAMSLAQPSSR
jgi:hypothetical protein